MDDISKKLITLLEVIRSINNDRDLFHENELYDFFEDVGVALERLNATLSKKLEKPIDLS